MKVGHITTDNLCAVRVLGSSPRNLDLYSPSAQILNMSRKFASWAVRGRVCTPAIVQGIMNLETCKRQVSEIKDMFLTLVSFRLCVGPNAGGTRHS